MIPNLWLISFTNIETTHNGKTVFLTFVYEDPVQKLTYRCGKITHNRSEPWIVIGNLNEITVNHEKQGETLRNALAFVQFNNMIEFFGNKDLPYRMSLLI